MAIGQFSCTYTEDYIELDISSSNFFCSLNSPPQTREFEFQMNSVSLEKEPAISPADELFYKGNLLPLHLPPRFQMVQKLTQNSKPLHETDTHFEENFQISFIPSSSAASDKANIHSPLETCNLSPTESCRFSFELKPVEHWTSTEMVCLQNLRQNKKSNLFQKLKASQAFIRALFSKTTCSDESCAKLAESRPKRKELGFKRHNFTATLMDKGKDKVNRQRRASFSASATKSPSVSSSGSSSLSSSFSFSSAGLYDPQVLKRCSSANSEMARSVEAAIAHCRHSQFL